MDDFTRRQFMYFAAGMGASLLSKRQQEKIQNQPMNNVDEEASVTFVARTPYNQPNGRYVRRFNDASVLSFFQRIWNSDKSSEQILGSGFYGLSQICCSEFEVPTTEDELVASLKKFCYHNSIVMKNGALEICTDDDEMDLVYYFFDNRFAKANPDRLAFLTHEDWLPTKVCTFAELRPTTYVASRNPSQSCDSARWDFFEVTGTRLGQIGKVCDVMKDDRYSDSHVFQSFLKSLPETTNWSQAIAKLVGEMGSFKDNGSTFQCSDHICELNFHESNWYVGQQNEKRIFSQLIVFDDVWAKSHPILVKSMRRLNKEALLFN